MVSGNPSGGAVGLLYGEWELGAGLKIDGDAASKYYNCCMVSGNPSGGAVGLLNGEWELGAGPKIHGDAASKYYNCCMVSGNPSGGAVGLLYGEWELGAGLKIDGDAASKYYNCCMVSGNPSGGAVGLLYGEWELGAGLKIHGDAASKYYNCCMVSGNLSGGAVGRLGGGGAAVEWNGAVIRTILLHPTPSVHGDVASKYYNCMVSGNLRAGRQLGSCMIRFYYQQNGRNYGSLSVDVVEVTTRGNITTSLWFSTKDKGENWYRAAIFLPNITRRYYLQFKTRMGMRIYSDSAIDDFSMAPECFGLNMDPKELGEYNYYDPALEEKTEPHPDFEDVPLYRFTTCGATGRSGPNQTMCDAAYFNTSVSVTVVKEPPFQGIQIWEVPSEGMYTIIATGASGGLGSAWTGVSYAAQSRGLFELHKGERLYMLVGQTGVSACKKTLSAQESQECSRRPSNDSFNLFTSKTHEVRNTEVHDGGGGGGGATFVFVIGKEGQAYPLLAAGGGGGVSVGVFRDDGSQHARARTNATPESGYMYGPPGRTSGAGGGWMSRVGPSTPGHELVRGAALLEGGEGGRACAGLADGGFGGGGGGCLRGGGGGGWLGGNTNEGEGQHGGGGWSYVDLARGVQGYSHVGPATRTGPGEVLVVPAVHKCGCAYRCVALNEHISEVTCYCPNTWISDYTDPTKCILEEHWTKQWLVPSLSGVLALVCLLLTGFACLNMYNGYQRRREAEQTEKQLMEQDMQLHRLRHAPAGDGALAMAFNPHYGGEGVLPRGVDVRGLPKVSRESLKLVKALGQGAFGEVYQGLYRHRSGDTAEMPVAVKTLPELSTGQAESDFLMEAAIMAKFNHPNVVHLIGVCFDRHPRFIVLELLAGGDLKNFLRESRPKPERASALTMKDLILCGLDVCKGARYLEGLRFIHRDIAARNCLLTSRGPGRVVKIADFGMARDVYRAEYYKKGGKAMLPIKWMPPEAYVDGIFTIKTDVWSFGVLLWEIFSLGMMPYTGCNNRHVMELVSKGGRLGNNHGCPEEIHKLMQTCWNPIASQRPTFSQLFDRLQRFLQDPAILNSPLPGPHRLIANYTNAMIEEIVYEQSTDADYLVPKPPLDAPPDASSTDQTSPHSKEPAETPEQLGTVEVSPYQPLLKASPEYGNIPMVTLGGVRRASASATSGGETRTSTKFLPSKSTDRLLSSVEGVSVDDGIAAEDKEGKPVIWETSFTKPRSKGESDPKQSTETGPAVDKLISITPTSPKPPDNALSQTIEGEGKLEEAPKVGGEAAVVKRSPETKPKQPQEPRPAPKPKPLCLDAAQLEQNLNTLKRNSGSVNLATMNIVPPYINVVTPSKLSGAPPIQIDPKRAVIHGLEEPKAVKSLINGPLTELPYADSDSNGSGGSHGGLKRRHYETIGNGNGKKPPDSEISC
ncbi:unnamed protein product, partial [Iphiclides podalirius]